MRSTLHFSRIISCLAAIIFILVPACLSAASNVATSKDPEPTGTLLLSSNDTVTFRENWGFVNQWSVSTTWNKDMPVTDLCLFAGDFDCYGNIIDKPLRSRVKDAGNARVHAVFICDGTSLTHLVLNPDFGYRDRLIDEIVAAVDDFDGLMIDFEAIPKQDNYLFHTFLYLLKSKLGDKMFSVCVPARTRTEKNDAYPYALIAAVADRVFIMAYDQHWSGSTAGPIAELDWSKRVWEYAKKVIPNEKIIMGMPLYGRTWASDSGASAWTYPSITQLLKDEKIDSITYSSGFPTFSYKMEIAVTGYYNDAYSIFQLAKQYETEGAQNIGFWRLGQEDTSFWKHLKIN